MILSEDSIESDWVEYEIKQARAREKKDGRRMLFPLGLLDYKALEDWELFDHDTATDLAAEVRSYFIPDFTDSEKYDESFQRLLDDLKAEN